MTTKVNPDPWEEAYLRFETPEEEIEKFVSRLRSLGADQWPKDARIVELFCGRGNGLHALERFGFTHLEGIDLSPTLVAQYTGRAQVHVGDCRSQPFDSASKDVMISQGGLHHLPVLPADLERTLDEIHRILRPNGRVVIVEPWQTPFLSFVHACARQPLLRRISSKLDAFHTMVQYEIQTYENWLSRGPEIRNLLTTRFESERSTTAWGKILFVGLRK